MFALLGEPAVEWRCGAELRAKYESFQNDTFGSAPDADHDYVWWRALPYIELSTERWRAMGQLVLAFESGDEAETTPIDEDRADVLQAFVDYDASTTLSLRAGRRVLAFGSERLISARYGPNVPRSFDAAGLRFEHDGWTLDALYGRPVKPEVGEFDDETDGAREMWTLYGTRAGLDLYYIGYENDTATFDQGTASEERHTLGSRIFGDGGRVDYNFELFAQAGSFGDGEIRAWSVASDSGYTFDGAPLEPRLGLKANVISGDHDPADEDLETFNPLFPKGKYFGESAQIGPSNLINVHPSIELSFSDEWSVLFASNVYWRESTDDGIYDNAGQIVRSDSGSDERFIGTQYDVVLAYSPSDAWEASVAGSLFEPGDFIEDTGPHETVRFFGIELVVSF